MAARHALRILVVDHDEGVVNVTTSMLEHLGYIVQGEQESSRALRAFSKNPAKFDLAIIEPIMPKLTGVELAVRLKRMRKDLPVILYAGYVATPLKQMIKTARLGRTVFKPLSLRELGDAVKRALHRARNASSFDFTSDNVCGIRRVLQTPLPAM